MSDLPQRSAQLLPLEWNGVAMRDGRRLLKMSLTCVGLFQIPYATQNKDLVTEHVACSQVLSVYNLLYLPVTILHFLMNHKTLIYTVLLIIIYN